MNRLRKQYQQEIVKKLQTELKEESVFAVPRINKVVVNMGVNEPKEARARGQQMEQIAEQFKIITGQKPQITTARKDIAGFGLRKGDPVGLMVTLRGERMWEFLDKLISIALPRMKDFQGVSRTAFDGHGNYSLGLEEQLVFPEIDYDKIDQVRGLQVTISTSATENEPAFRLLELLGMPFAKEETKENHG